MMELVIDARGGVACLYDEMIDLAALGSLTIRRASHVEPDDEGQWWADLAPVGGPKMGPWDWRSEALAGERAWLETHWLPSLDVGKHAQSHAQAGDRKHCPSQSA